MIKISTITALGFLVIIVASPFFAVPRSWKEIILVASGITVVVLSFLIRQELHKVIRIVHGVAEEKADTYVENNPK
jgi:FtsH-binding integral membrane protein